MKVSSNTVDIFGKVVVIPEKYVLEAQSSLLGPSIHYRTSNLSRSKDTPLEFVTIGNISDYKKRHGIENLGSLGKITQKYLTYSEVAIDAPQAVNGKEYVYRVYFNDELYISYMVLNIADIDVILRDTQPINN